MFIVGLLGLAVYAEDGDGMRAVLATAVVWTLGRWAFWDGYHLGSAWRGLGAPSMLLGQLVLGYVGLRVGHEPAGEPGAWAVLIAFLSSRRFCSGRPRLPRRRGHLPPREPIW